MTPGSKGVRIRNVYVHAPFCARRCFYCDFAVTVRRAAEPEPWFSALAGELRLLYAEHGIELDASLETVYLGGGTPSLLGPQAVLGLRDVLGTERFSSETEFTAEANPESFTREVAEAWQRAGLTRLSLGTQSFQPSALRWMGRLHGAEGSREAVQTARTAGLANLSIDLIFGLPDEVERDWVADLDEVLRLEAPHVSLYGLSAESATPLGRRVAEGRIQMPDDERYAREYLLAHERLTAEGYEHYEVSNFARPGHQSVHNRRYWTGHAYLGLGNGAHSFVPPVRSWNVRDWTDYAAAIGDGRLPRDAEEHLDGRARALEDVWLGLRTDAGLLVHEQAHAAVAEAERWRAQGWARIEVEGAGRRVRLTPEGWLRLDPLAVALDEVLELPAVPAELIESTAHDASIG